MPHLADQLKAIAVRYRISSLYVFGSRTLAVARKIAGEISPPDASESDVDIGVQLEAGHRLAAPDRVQLAADLEDLFGASRVDLIVLPEADPFLALDVIRGELLYCSDKDAQAEEELLVLRRAGDLAPYARERWNQILTGSAL